MSEVRLDGAERCKSCGSKHLRTFNGEIAIHVSGRKDGLPVLVFPKLLMCLACGIAQFVVREDELRTIKADSDSSND